MTKRNYAFVCLFCLFFLSAAAATGAQSPTSPSPSAMVPDSTFEFAPVLEGITIAHDFVIENTGAVPLLIDKIHAGCGCTTVSYDKEIPPGGKGTVSVEVNTQGYGGRRLWKRVLVQTNDPENPKFYLKIGGNVEEFVDIEPRKVELVGHLGKVLKEQVTIIPVKAYPFKIVEISAGGGKNIQLELEEVKTSGETKYLLTVFNLRKETGQYHDMIYLKTDSEIRPEILINVYGRIKGP